MYFTVYFISPFSILIPVLVSIITFKKQNKNLRLLSYLFFIGGFFDLILPIFQTAYNLQTILFYQLFDFIQFTLLILIIFPFKKFPLTKLKLLILPLLFTLSWLLFEFNINTKSPTSYSAVFASFLLILAAIYNLYTLAKDTTLIIYKNYMFWINISVLIYFAGTIFVQTITLIFPELTVTVWELHTIMNLVSNITFALSYVTFIKYLKKT